MKDKQQDKSGQLDPTDDTDDTDGELFRMAVWGATPMPPSIIVNPVTPRSAVIHRPLTATDADTLSDHFIGEEPLTEFLRPGISRMILRKLRRGQNPIQATLDLHGLNSDEARKVLVKFLRQATQLDNRRICVIHGKGRQAGGGDGVLKIRTRHWLTQCAEVLAFCEAPPNAGGGGAVLVLLKSANGENLAGDTATST